MRDCVPAWQVYMLQSNLLHDAKLNVTMHCKQHKKSTAASCETVSLHGKYIQCDDWVDKTMQGKLSSCGTLSLSLLQRCEMNAKRNWLWFLETSKTTETLKSQAMHICWLTHLNSQWTGEHSYWIFVPISCRVDYMPPIQLYYTT